MAVQRGLIGFGPQDVSKRVRLEEYLQLALPLRLHRLDCLFKKPLVNAQFNRTNDIFFGGCVLPKQGTRCRSVRIGDGKLRLETNGLVIVFNGSQEFAKGKVSVAPVVEGQGMVRIETNGLVEILDGSLEVP